MNDDELEATCIDVSSTAAGAVASRAADFTQAQLELQNTSFDGETLSGRLLVSPTSAKLRIDRRLIESFALSVDSVKACGTGTGLPYVIMDVLASPLQEKDILTLAPGYWYGKEVRIFLFAEHATKQPPPQCFEADIVYHALDVKNAARLHVRVERVPKDTVAPSERTRHATEDAASPPQ
jgi:hypothetical protein